MGDHYLAAPSVQAPPEPFRTVLTFDWPRPPLHANQRLTWRAKAATTRQVRDVAHWAAKRIPDLGRVRVTLTWVVNTKTRRDADNIVPTLKALADGLVDAGLVADDTPDLMDKVMPVIRYERGSTPHFELLIEQVTR